MEMCKISRVRTQGNQIPNQPLFRGGLLTQELPIHSWNLMGPLVVSASKSGAVSPKRSPIAAKQDQASARKG